MQVLVTPEGGSAGQGQVRLEAVVEASYWGAGDRGGGARKAAYQGSGKRGDGGPVGAGAQFPDGAELVTARDFGERVAQLEEQVAPRWVWASTASVYPQLLAAGVRVQRCHDLTLTEALLRAHEGGLRETSSDPDPDFGNPPVDVGLGSPMDDGPGSPLDAGRGSPLDGGRGSLFDVGQGSLFDVGQGSLFDAGQGSLFDAGQGSLFDAEQADSARQASVAARLREVYAGQLARIEAARKLSPGFALLVAAESAAALAAAEMGHVGLPWRSDVHDQVLTDLLGKRPRHGGRPARLQELATEVALALGAAQRGGVPAVNVDSPQELLRALRRCGVLVQSTRAHELKQVEHPAIGPLLRYKELVRLHVAHGWAWRDQWVREGRFKPEYVPGGVVSGRWATKGGGALQIPKAMRACVVADPGWALVVADAGQLEPRILAALSGDRGMIAATQDDDLYTALARQALGRPEARAEMKIALLAAMYGARANSPAMSALRRRFPQALALLEDAARIGEDGGIVRSALGRTCPLPDPGWQQCAEPVALARSRSRGRFTRNFVIQATAADWANSLVAGLRQRLAKLEVGQDRAGLRRQRPELVFFQHDEVIVHTPEHLVGAVIAAIAESGAEATRLVIGDQGVSIPLTGARVGSYAEKSVQITEPVEQVTPNEPG